MPAPHGNARVEHDELPTREAPRYAQGRTERCVTVSSTGATVPQRRTDELRRQIDRDVGLIDAGVCSKVERHFFPSNISNRTADDPELVEYLTDNGIPYVIHLP